MNVYFELVLLTLTIGFGIIIVCDKKIWAPKRAGNQKVDAKGKPILPFAVDYARSLFPIFLIVLIIRAFLVDLFVIPSGSMLPTLQIGDFIWVNKYHYGLRLPLFHTLIYPNQSPKAGDVIVFHFPVDSRLNFIKRVIGEPGDKVQYYNKQLMINGKSIPEENIQFKSFLNATNEKVAVTQLNETINNINHLVYRRDTPMELPLIWTVPADTYFVMGDNRDDSEDSRFWGFVPKENIVGKAFLVILSWNKHEKSIRRERLFKKII